MSWLILPALIVSLSAVAARAATRNLPVPSDGTSSTQEKPTKDLRELIDQSVNWYQLYVTPESRTPMRAVPVLRWNNNVRGRGSAEGLTVLWITKGRPQAAACIYPWEGRLCHSFDSLSRATIAAKRDETVVWHPTHAGVEFRPVPDAPAPADSPAARLKQMKELAGHFSSVMVGWKADNSDREELRLLSRPIYRYESEDADVLDGAVFAFVLGTDPESVLLLEAVRIDERYEWQYAFARRTSGGLEGRHRGSTVWTAPKHPQENDPTRTNITFTSVMEP